MSQFYSNPTRETDEFALPDAEVFQLTDEEAAAVYAHGDDDMVMRLLKRFPLASMNSREHAKLIDAIIEETGPQGGWYYQYCFPGCMPESEPMGPYATRDEAIAACRDECAE